MKSKKLISLFFFLILGVQVLPLQRIAVWLSSGQLTEEMAHGVNPVKAKSLMDEIDPGVCTVQSFHAGIYSLLLATLEKHHRDETPLTRHADDILTPPPNV